MNAITTSRRKALSLRRKSGGWVLGEGETYTWTDDQGHAVDWLLSSVNEDRAVAWGVVHHPRLARDRAPVLTPALARRLAGTANGAALAAAWTSWAAAKA